MFIQSPLNYTGGKYKLLPQIIPLFPEKVNTFVDLFCGGCNVGININANKVIYNDIDINLHYFFNALKNLDKENIFEWINSIIIEYDLSQVSKYGYKFYNCDSSKGLGEYNKEKFNKLKADFNKKTLNENYDYFYYIMFYVIIIYSFNNQIRFNSKGEFNLPVGKRDFNEKMQNKLSLFIDRIKEQNSIFTCQDFRKFNIDDLNCEDFIYMDPPYLITCATYNENDGWNGKDELELLKFIEEINRKKIKFALSNILKSKGKENNILIEWIDNNNFNVNYLNFNYSNSNYQTKNKEKESQEVLITNY